ncbi:hypothetical protein KX928_00180 [Roseobacter sp. YSTF-M11]|uniref:Uncharacterized protein n=1 Tax=Roseobacter insulae TaxID=2859783 RepID=A0A9X1FSA9_9RHOB|nr:hypothetical protein [Roseobacter insulae]MBW4706195.1 hypothetical protein [Roseobacter insulae]
MSPGPASKMRILVSASSFADAAAAMHIAQRMTEGIARSLGGLLVDDDDTRAACAIPNRRIVSASGALLITPSPSQMHTLMNADANAFQQLLKKTADLAAVDWSFERQMGDLIDTATRVATGWDALIFGYRSSHSFAGKVIMFDPLTPDDGQLLGLSHMLASHLRADLIAFGVGPLAVQARGEEHPTKVLFDTVEDAIAALDRTNAQVVLIDLFRGPVRDAEQLKRVLAASRCPVVVLGASSLVATVEHKMHVPPPRDAGDAPSS